MEFQLKIQEELPDGSAIAALTLDNEAKEYLIGEGMLVVLKKAIANSESWLGNKEMKTHELEAVLDAVKPKGRRRKK
jgi:hypothetical protein